MTTPPSPSVLLRLDTAGSATLADLLATFEELQTALRCCERLVSELAESAADDIACEAVWTMALMSYCRCFAPERGKGAVSPEDVTAALPQGNALEWHRVLVQLREHYADPAANPRERFSVGVAQGADGTAAGVGITSVRQPMVDDVTVRQTGALAFALRNLVEDRISAQQATVFEEMRGRSKAELDRLGRLDIALP
ncbi:MAG: hypothetical protein ACR2LF_03720 [Jatrophihabitantaceae bacterium]